MTERRKRLIEVAFPLEEVSEHSRREKYLGSPHPQTLHLWWARRPLAACRAFIYAALVNDPESEAEREALLKEVADLASWDAVRRPDVVVRAKPKGSGLTGNELLRRARERILRDNEGTPPRLLDPFAGGGAIPLEALRLGCEVEASDLNPVAVLILKGTVEYPQRYGRPLDEQIAERPGDCAGVDGRVPAHIRENPQSKQSRFSESDVVDAYHKNPLAAEVGHWGTWMLNVARSQLTDLYPTDEDGATPIAYLWSRTVPCPNCAARMPMIRQYWLARTEKKHVALRPTVDRAEGHVDFEVTVGLDVTGDPGEATTSRGDTICLVCGQVLKAEYIRQSGRDGKIGTIPTAVVLDSKGGGGKRYRPDTPADQRIYRLAETRLNELEAKTSGELPLVPDEPMPRHLTGGVITSFGYDTFGKLFNSRQLVTLSTFAHLVREAHSEMISAGLSAGFAEAIATYLAFCVDRLARENSTLTRWNGVGEKAQGAFGQQAFPMVWDFAELNPFAGSVGDWSSAVQIVVDDVTFLGEVACSAKVLQRPAQQPPVARFDVIVTDPPYYDAINYADLSDFFYAWLKRSLSTIRPSEFALPLTPKKGQTVMNPHAIEASGDRVAAARGEYVSGMTEAFRSMAEALSPAGLTAVVFAHTDPSAWATLLEGLLSAGIAPDASWPIDTEMGSKVAGQGQARLATSVWMACRPQGVAAGTAFLDTLQAELRTEVESKLLDFWQRGVRGADFFISAIGPALSVFGRHSKVLRPDGTEVTVREFLDLVRRESTRVALQQVLHQDDLGAIDETTRAYVTWVWSYGKAPLDAGEAIALCLATGADLDAITRPHSFGETAKDKSKKVVRLRTIAARARDDEDLGQSHGARVTPLIDELQYAAWLWGANRSADIAKFRSSLGEQRWRSVRMLGQAVAECLPEGDDDRRIINGMLGSSATSGAAPDAVAGTQGKMEMDA